MATSTVTWLGYEVEIDRPGEFAHTDMPAADERWTYVDQEGHGHFWKDKGYPTLVWRPEPCTMGHDDCDAEGQYECRICGEEIRPGTRRADPIWIAGPVSITLRVRDTSTVRTYRLSEDQWAALQGVVADAVQSTLRDEDLVEVYQFGPHR